MCLQLFDLSGKTALVTGSSRGLGRAFAEGLGKAGARIILNGTNEVGLAKTAAALGANGLDVTTAAFDITDETAVKGTFDKFDKDGVTVDILVNNAGIQFRKPMLELETADWQRVIDVNLTAAFVVGREAACRMSSRGSGKIINIGSVMSTVARATIAPYSVSKGGIKLLTQAMAAEWSSMGIQANAIGPGYMETDMNEALIADHDFNAWVKSRTPSRRWGAPEELVGTAIFLASNASNYVSGQIIYVDGGMTSVL
ncbi:SDR family oxidoreductase [Roseibium sediminicola]|uniref:SDR family oxidoreductase n=1 Tax=Roseibium sediminicola TaxID=2933272 RepID=A0ABT0GPL5_9HYPH|nr:SDR family oxidoreductase [Roseibium sp. CAU 1639]MCK7611364.1 SDR family oxidoreductase [Roseibium sp. CAU 1639]